jgi:tRNA A-37 threonylcarbamoyl transferase component Bud32
MFDSGAQVGPYRIIGELGGGGMGTVYRAAHTVLHREVAIKVLRPELSDRGDAIGRFLAEARTTAALRHPGIVEVYDFGHTDTGEAFLVMELLVGETLGARLANQGRLSVFEAMVLARRIAAPLALAHERGIVHRDLKPDNVFLVHDHEGGSVAQVKLFDFGVATLTSPADPSRIPVGFVLGTPAYMSPEQCRGLDCDHRTDLYALGCILFELLTGAPPYGYGTAEELAIAHLRSAVPDVGRRASVPAEVARLVTRLLDKRPRDRPRDAREVVAQIDRYLVSRVPGRRLGMAARGVRWLVTRAARWLRSSLAVFDALATPVRAPRAPVGAPRRARINTRIPTVVLRRSAIDVADLAMTRADTQSMREPQRLAGAGHGAAIDAVDTIGHVPGAKLTRRSSARSGELV